LVVLPVSHQQLAQRLGALLQRTLLLRGHEGEAQEIG